MVYSKLQEFPELRTIISNPKGGSEQFSSKGGEGMQIYYDRYDRL